jgi:hypothetical protein
VGGPLENSVAGAVKASKGADPVIVLPPQGEALEALVR